MLARECEALLKSAQTQIDEAMGEPGVKQIPFARGVENGAAGDLSDERPF